MTIQQTVIITGATGFLGRNLTQLLARQGCNVVPVGRRPFATPDSDPTSPQVQLLDRDVRASFLSILQRTKPHAIIHCAGTINGTAEQLRAGNEELTSALVSATEEYALDLHFIFFSSVSALQPFNAYGKSKAAAEEVIRRSKLQRWTILQPGLLYGRYDTKNVAKLSKLVHRSPIIPVPGGAVVKLQPLYVEDLVAPLLRLLQQPDLGRGKSYVVAGPQQESLWDMIGAIRASVRTFCLRIPIPLWPLEWGVKTLHQLFPTLKLPVQQLLTVRNRPKYDTTAAETELGFSPRVFAQGICETLLKTKSAAGSS